MGKIPYLGYKKEKRPDGMSMKEWATSKFKPNPKYKGKYPRWMFYARLKRLLTNGKHQYSCIPFVSYSKSEVRKQIKRFCKTTKYECIKIWRHGPLNWTGYNVAWALDKKAK